MKSKTGKLQRNDLLEVLGDLTARNPDGTAPTLRGPAARTPEEAAEVLKAHGGPHGEHLAEIAVERPSTVYWFPGDNGTIVKMTAAEMEAIDAKCEADIAALKEITERALKNGEF